MDKLSKDILINFLGWEVERSCEQLENSTPDNFDWSVMDRVSWLNKKIAEVKEGLYDN